jgi:hypothetical protein
MSAPLNQQIIVGSKPPELNKNETMRMPIVQQDTPKIIEKLMDAGLLYIPTMTRLLYSASLVKTNQADPNSPLPGYTLVKITSENGNWRPNINALGYMTVCNTFILFVDEAISTTDFKKDEKIKEIALRASINIMDMMTANRKRWEFTDYNMIRTLGLGIYFNILAVSHRSAMGAKGLRLAFQPGLYGGEQNNVPMQEPKKNRWFL